MLTKKQNEFLKKLKSYIQKFGYFPSVRELKDYMGFSSVNSVWKYLQILKSKGYLRKNKRKYELSDSEYFRWRPSLCDDLFSEFLSSFLYPGFFQPPPAPPLLLLRSPHSLVPLSTGSSCFLE